MLRQEMGWFDRKDNGVGALCAQLSGDAASVQGVRIINFLIINYFILEQIILYKISLQTYFFTGRR